MTETEPFTEAVNDGPLRLGYSVRGIANWILDYADELGVRHTNMGINKLVYFAVEAFLVRKNVLLTNAKIEAWEHGPVFRELYQSFKAYGNGAIGGRAKFFSPVSEEYEEAIAHLTDDDAMFLKQTIEPIINCSASELRALSHAHDGAWHKVWWYAGHANPGMEISPALIAQIATGVTVEKG